MSSYLFLKSYARRLSGVKDVGEIVWHADSPKQTAIEYAEEG